MIEHETAFVDGVEYKAVIEPDTINRCDACVASSNWRLCNGLPECREWLRIDCCNVVYKPHYRPKHNELPIKVIEL